MCETLVRKRKGRGEEGKKEARGEERREESREQVIFKVIKSEDSLKFET